MIVVKSRSGDGHETARAFGSSTRSGSPANSPGDPHKIVASQHPITSNGNQSSNTDDPQP